MQKITVTILVILALVIPALAVLAWYYAQRALPVMDGDVLVSDLSRPVEVKFDEQGVPYIQAKSERDAYLAQGFVTASERMFQMDVLRRTAIGELSEVFGGDSLSHDKLMRTIGFNRLGREEYKQLPADMKSDLQAYCQGVNAYIEDATNRMPLEFIVLGYQPRKWETTDTLAILKYLQYEAEESWQLDDLRQRVLDKVGDKLANYLFEQNLKTGEQAETLMPSDDGRARLLSQAYSMLQPKAVLPQPLPIWGSNAWVVSPAVSDNKGALLANDMHSAFASPDRYYLCSLSSPELHVAGATIPGVPGVVEGRNDNIAFGSTVLRADTQDLVLEQLSPQFPGKYRTVSNWANVTELTEDIPVRFGKSVVEKILATHHGSVLLQNENTAACLNWTGYNTKEPVLKTILKLDHASNWQEFSTTLSAYAGAVRTFVYADRQGNIGYHVAGPIPVRTGGGAVVSTGWTGAADWKGLMKFDDMPHGYNPAQGYAVADDPDFEKVSFYNNPLRALRIGAALDGFKKSGQRVGLPEMALLQGDQTASLAPLVKKELDQVISKSQIIDEFQNTALESLRRWDGTLKPDSAASSIYESFLRTLTRRVLEAKLGSKMTQEYLERWPRWSLFTEKIMRTKPKEWLPPEERTYETFFITTLSQAMKNIRLACKIDDVTKCSWQTLHQIQFQPVLSSSDSQVVNAAAKLFNVAPVGVGGDQDTVNACDVVASVDPFNFKCDSGPVERLLVDMADTDKFYASLTLGQSEHLFSPYRTDQLRNWMRLEPHSVAFSPDQLEKQQQHKVIFTNR